MNGTFGTYFWHEQLTFLEGRYAGIRFRRFRRFRDREHWYDWSRPMVQTIRTSGTNPDSPR
jgi:hypothetical protein